MTCGKWSSVMAGQVIGRAGLGSVLDAYSGAVSGHEATPNYHFVPASWRVDSLPSITFDLDQQRSAERYAPEIASTG